MEMRERFLSELIDYATKCKPRNLISREDYEKTVLEYEAALKNTKSKRSHEYRLLHRFALIDIDGVKKLVLPSEKEGDTAPEIIIPMESIYDKLLEIHVTLHHACRDRLQAEISGKYAFIPRKAIEIFLSLCETCQLKKKKAKKGLVSETNYFQHLQCSLPSRSDRYAKSTRRPLQIHAGLSGPSNKICSTSGIENQDCSGGYP